MNLSNVLLGLLILIFLHLLGVNQESWSNGCRWRIVIPEPITNGICRDLGDRFLQMPGEFLFLCEREPLTCTSFVEGHIVLVAFVAEPSVKLVTKICLCQAPFSLKKAPPHEAYHLFPSLSLNLKPVSVWAVSFYLWLWVTETSSIFLFFIYYSWVFPILWKLRDGSVAVATPYHHFFVSQQFFYILIKSLFIVCKASFPSTAALQGRFPVWPEY